MAELNIEDIVRWELKDTLSFNERNNIITTCISLVDGKNKGDGLFKNLAIEIALTLGGANYFDKDDNLLGQELGDLSLDELYELTKKVDIFSNASKELTYCLSEVKQSLLQNYSDIMVEQSLTSKYDEILTNIGHLVELYLQDITDADMEKVAHDIGILSKKLGSVSEETLIQTILKNLKKEDVN